MKEYRLDSSPYKPVSHDPALKKRVLMSEPVSCVRHISHIVLKPGDMATEHTHAGSYEIFYCVRGATVFGVNGADVTVKKGSCLVVEPGEAHSIKNCLEETELLYLLAANV